MSSQGDKPPRFNQSNPLPIRRFLAFLQSGNLEAQQRYREREKQQALTATFPWLQLTTLLSVYFLTGLLVSFLPGLWGVIAWMAVAVLSLLLLSEVFGGDMIDSGSLCVDFLSALVIYGLARPVVATSEALSNVMKRRIFATTPPGPALNRKLDCVSLYCFLVILLIEAAGLWFGYLTKTWFF